MKESIEKFTSDFQLFEQNLNGIKNSFIHNIRREAIESFSGFPTLKDEEWKYTNLSKLEEQSYDVIVTKSPDTQVPEGFDELADLKANKLVFINGFFSPGKSIIIDNEDIVISSLAQEIEKNNSLLKQYLNKNSAHYNNSLLTLNTAFIRDGAFIRIPRGKSPAHPVVLYYISKNANKSISQPRNLFVIEENSHCQVAEYFHNAEQQDAFSNTVTEISLGENAYLYYYNLQLQNDHYSHVGTTLVNLENNSRFYAYMFSFGGNLIRNNLNVTLGGEGIECHIYGLYVLDDHEHVDNHVIVEHAKPNCYSNQLFKGILNDESTGVFNGKVLVKQDAQKTNAFQSNKNILLSDKATINTKPQLEIFADDVKCSHGATSGQLDKNALFYLRSRGMNEEQARGILTRAFAAEVIEKVPNEALSAFLMNTLSNKLGVDK